MGANLAMRDAADRALTLAWDGDWRTVIWGYEAAMFARAEAAAVGAREGINEVFSEDGSPTFSRLWSMSRGITTDGGNHDAEDM